MQLGLVMGFNFRFTTKPNIENGDDLEAIKPLSRSIEWNAGSADISVIDLAVSEKYLKPSPTREGQCGLLANVLVQTQRMLDAARDHDWPAVATLERERSQLLTRCLSRPVSHEKSKLFHEALAVLLLLNDELVGLMNQAKL